LAISTGFGRLTSAEIKACMDQGVTAPDFDQIVDFREVTFVEVSGGQTRALANKALFSPESKRAVVAPNPAHFGFGRMFAAYHEMSESPSRVQVVYDLSSALRWLGIENNSELLQALPRSSTQAETHTG
jgi:hypothetical protein